MKPNNTVNAPKLKRFENHLIPSRWMAVHLPFVLPTLSCQLPTITAHTGVKSAGSELQVEQGTWQDFYFLNLIFSTPLCEEHSAVTRGETRSTPFSAGGGHQQKTPKRSDVQSPLGHGEWVWAHLCMCQRHAPAEGWNLYLLAYIKKVNVLAASVKCVLILWFAKCWEFVH